MMNKMLRNFVFLFFLVMYSCYYSLYTREYVPVNDKQFMINNWELEPVLIAFANKTKKEIKDIRNQNPIRLENYNLSVHLGHSEKDYNRWHKMYDLKFDSCQVNINNLIKRIEIRNSFAENRLVIERYPYGVNVQIGAVIVPEHTDQIIFTIFGLLKRGEEPEQSFQHTWNMKFAMTENPMARFLD